MFIKKNNMYVVAMSVLSVFVAHGAADMLKVTVATRHHGVKCAVDQHATFNDLLAQAKSENSADRPSRREAFTSMASPAGSQDRVPGKFHPGVFGRVACSWSSCNR